jgi:glutathione S-transferase
MTSSGKPFLYVGNQNYSSWSMRPWLVLTWSKIPFETRVVPLGGEGYGKARQANVLAISPSGRVPALHMGDTVVWDSLAISEWVAEMAPEAELWPRDPATRALCRSVTAEMHSGFSALRSKMPCNIRRRADPKTPPRESDPEVKQDLERLTALWTDLRGKAGAGPYLFGARPTIADAFFAPVATRLRTYGVKVGGVAEEYAAAILGDPAVRAWERAGAAETLTMPVWDSV